MGASENAVSTTTDGTVIPIVGYSTELLSPGYVKRQGKILSLPFQFPMTSRLPALEQLASKYK